MPFIQHKWLFSLNKCHSQMASIEALGEIATFGLVYEPSGKFLRKAEVALCSSLPSGLPSWTFLITGELPKIASSDTIVHDNW